MGGKLPWIRRVNIVKMAVPLKLVYRINAVPVKVTAGFFAEIYCNPKS